MLHRILIIARALLRRGTVESELDEELRYHFDREVERLVASGLSPVDARLAAKRVFGNTTQFKEDVRDSWGVRWSEHLVQDVRFALRGFRRSPAFVVTVVSTIALALGLNTSAFTVVDAYVLRSAGVRDAGTLYEAAFSDRRGAERWLSLREYQDLRSIVKSETFAFTPAFTRIEGRAMLGNLVTGNALELLGARPALGRMLVPEDVMSRSGEPVIVLSYDAWQTKFGGDSAIIGRRIVAGAMRLTVAGVAANGFTGVGPTPSDFWAPITLMPGFRRDSAVKVALRLGPGMDEQRLVGMLAGWSARATAASADSLRLVHAQLTSLRSALPLSPETI